MEGSIIFTPLAIGDRGLLKPSLMFVPLITAVEKGPD